MNQQQYWNQRYAEGGNSGAGSYGDAMLRKVDLLAGLPDVRSVIDVGCGDFSLGGELTRRKPDALYLGIDQSEFIVKRNAELYESDKIHFMREGEVAMPHTDLVLCLDVLFHISNLGEYYEILAKLRSLWTKYLVVTAYEYDGLQANHIWVRKFDPERFGKPIIQETIEEDGKMQFYVFER